MQRMQVVSLVNSLLWEQVNDVRMVAIPPLVRIGWAILLTRMDFCSNTNLIQRVHARATFQLQCPGGRVLPLIKWNSNKPLRIALTLTTTRYSGSWLCLTRGDYKSVFLFFLKDPSRFGQVKEAGSPCNRVQPSRTSKTPHDTGQKDGICTTQLYANKVNKVETFKWRTHFPLITLSVYFHPVKNPVDVTSRLL